MAAPVRHRIELYAMRELHLERLVKPNELVGLLRNASRLANLVVDPLLL